MKKKILSLALILAMIAAFVPFYGVSAAGESDFVIENDVLVQYTGEDSSIVIPDSVTAIDDWAFAFCENLYSVTIPDSVESIGMYAFAYCDITDIVIPASVRSIGYYAFGGCSSLTEVTVWNPNVSFEDGVNFGDDDAYQHIRNFYFAGSEAQFQASLPVADSVDADFLAEHYSIGLSKNVTIHYNYNGTTTKATTTTTTAPSATTTTTTAPSATTTTTTTAPSATTTTTTTKATTTTTTTPAVTTKLAITEQPADVIAKANASVTFTVKAVGDGLTYQWQLSDDQGKTWRTSKITAASYTTTLTAANSGRYFRCVVKDKAGNSLISDAAYMKLTSLKITEQPVSVTAKSGDGVSFKVKAQGEGLTYQWQLSDDQGKTWRTSKITADTYATTLTAANSGRYFRCVVTDKYGISLKSDIAYMKVTSLKITGQPVSVTAKSGNVVTFTVTANGPGISYTWQLSDDKGKTWRDSSTKLASYATTLTTANSGRYVRCVVTDKYGNSIISNAVYMNVTTLKITAQPVSVTAKSGDVVNFAVKAQGPDITYTWQLSDDQGKTWRNSKITADTYATTLTAANSGRYFRCVVTDKYGNSVKSDIVYMKVTSLKITGQPANATGKKGALVTFKVTAQGPGITYQWQLSDNKGKTWRNSKNTTASYTTTLSSSNNGRYVRCIVTDKYGNSVKSKSASMKIK